MATESLPMAPPIAERPGPIGWMRRNLFATPFDIALTLLVVADPGDDRAAPVPLGGPQRELDRDQPRPNARSTAPAGR